jgi:DNA-binding MarR family transcriptional regulator
MDNSETYLQAILATVARQTFPPDALFETIATGSAGAKQLKAYNMCDGTHTQSEIASALSLDKSNFSKSLSRWIDAGIVIRIGEGRKERPLHVYPLPKSEVVPGNRTGG